MTLLVVSTVHSADDTRIRERLIRTLSERFEVRYATRAPGPADAGGLSWEPLSGGRVVRWWRALLLLLSPGWDVAVIHDPELVPAAVIARFWRRRPVVFDVHEDLAAQIASKEWIPYALRGPFRVLSRLLYRLADSVLILTLAEAGYRQLFRRNHPVFPNYPMYVDWPDPVEHGDGRVVYLGDVTHARGVTDAAAAALKAGLTLRIVGPVPGSLVADLGGVELYGRLPNPEALRVAASSALGISPLRDAPNYRDSLPTKVIEYLALGLPVVATNLPGTRTVAEDWEAVWLVPPGDIDAMALALREASNPEVRVLARSRAAYVRSRYVWPRAEVLDWFSALEEKAQSPGEVHRRQGRGNGDGSGPDASNGSESRQN